MTMHKRWLPRRINSRRVLTAWQSIFFTTKAIMTQTLLCFLYNVDRPIEQCYTITCHLKSWLMLVFKLMSNDKDSFTSTDKYCVTMIESTYCVIHCSCLSSVSTPLTKQWSTYWRIYLQYVTANYKINCK